MNNGQKSFTTVEACKEECAKTEGCVAFTTQAGTYNTCWLKKKGHSDEKSSAKSAIAISVRMSCYEGMYLSPNTPGPYYICTEKEAYFHLGSNKIGSR